MVKPLLTGDSLVKRFGAVAASDGFSMEVAEGELHALIGGFQRWGWLMLLLSLGMIISAAYAIRTVGRLFTGPVRSRMARVDDHMQSRGIVVSSSGESQASSASASMSRKQLSRLPRITRSRMAAPRRGTPASRCARPSL